jgi:serine/threonine-protein kinase RsbW
MRYRSQHPARPQSLTILRRSLREWFGDAGIQGDDADELLLAIDEAASNAVSHAYRGRRGSFTVTATRFGKHVVFVVADEGQWREHAPNGGRGIPLIERLSDAVQYQRDAAGTTVVVARRLRAESWVAAPT